MAAEGNGLREIALNRFNKTGEVHIARSKVSFINSIGILDAGIMGLGIAQVSARAGLSVIIQDVENHIVVKALSNLEKRMSALIKKGKLSDISVQRTMARIKGTTCIQECVSKADLLTEAVCEDMSLKKCVFEETSKYCGENTIIASNTSGFSISEMSKSVQYPANFIGMHFFNPVTRMRLVERSQPPHGTAGPGGCNWIGHRTASDE